MAHRAVAKVVTQARQLEDKGVDLQSGVGLQQAFGKLFRQVADTQAMLEPRVRRAWKNVMDCGQLLDAPQALEFLRVDDVQQARLPLRVPVDIAKDGFHLLSVGTPF